MRGARYKYTVSKGRLGETFCSWHSAATLLAFVRVGNGKAGLSEAHSRSSGLPTSICKFSRRHTKPCPRIAFALSMCYLAHRRAYTETPRPPRTACTRGE